MNCRTVFLGLLIGWMCSSSRPAMAQPTAAEALSLKPMQADVQHDRPNKAETEKCRIAAEDFDGQTAWAVRNQAGEILRLFLDSNDDNKVDQWRYFKSGIEVYRDVDENFNGKADQYRWLGTAGTRWGLDEDEDGGIDTWKSISAEETTAEVIEAIKRRDKKRFQNVLLRPDELAALGLGKKLNKTIAERVQSALRNFDQTVAGQTTVNDETEWIDFGGLRPGTIPKGTDGSSRDVTVYENVVAMVETDGKPSQVPMGTLVQVGDGWRVVDLPISDGEKSTPQFVFFEGASQRDLDETTGVSEETQKLITRLQEIDDRLEKTKDPTKLALANEQRADTLEQLAKAAVRISDRDMWWMQFADTVGTAAQSGTYPKGTGRLAKLRKTLERTSKNKDLVAHVAFTHMSAEYAEQLSEDDADFTEVQEAWLKKLESFIDRYPGTTDAPEAMLQLALAKEFAGEEKDANRWYTSIVDDFGNSPLAAKAAGAKRRLESVGKPLSLRGRTIEGKPFDLKRLKGNVVLVHYWATWCQPCKQDMKIIKQLRKEFAGAKFEAVGINVDAQPDEVARHFRSERPSWTHLYEKGGLDGRLASEMGVFTLPVMFLVDQRGRVVNRQIHGGQLKKEIGRLLK